LKSILPPLGTGGIVFDPFCGRGTTVFQSLIQGRNAAGCDVHPVAVCVSGAKADAPAKADVLVRLGQLEDLCAGTRPGASVPSGLEEFFALCFAPGTLHQVMFLRSALNWEQCRTDRFIAALALGALHGESHRSPNCFSNRMPRTISTKPAYSIRWWKRHGYDPPERDVFEILRCMTRFRFVTPPPERTASIRRVDTRHASNSFPSWGSDRHHYISTLSGYHELSRGSVAAVLVSGRGAIGEGG